MTMFLRDDARCTVFRFAVLIPSDLSKKASLYDLLFLIRFGGDSFVHSLSFRLVERDGVRFSRGSGNPNFLSFPRGNAEPAVVAIL